MNCANKLAVLNFGKVSKGGCSLYINCKIKYYKIEFFFISLFFKKKDLEIVYTTTKTIANIKQMNKQSKYTVNLLISGQIFPNLILFDQKI